MTQQPTHMAKCFLCQNSFQFGPHVYNGRPIPQWGGIMLCDTCDNWNWDGLVPSAHPRLLEYFKAAKITPSYNEKGWIDIPPRGSR
jgi:hypothetical protein